MVDDRPLLPQADSSSKRSLCAKVGVAMALLAALTIVLTPLGHRSVGNAHVHAVQNMITAPDPAQCDAYTFCTHLAGDCCPTIDGVKLYCCAGG